MKKKTKLNLWSNTYIALDWFKHIENEKEWKFIEVVFKKALNFAKNRLRMKLARIRILRFEENYE